MTTAQGMGCDFEQLRREGALFYHRCKRCGRVLPSFDTPERTHFYPCTVGRAGARAARRTWRDHRYLKLLGSFVSALRRWKKSGFLRPTPGDLAARSDACRWCPLQQRLGPAGAIERCSSCGCWLPLKRRMAGEQCPAERWPGQRHAGGQGLVMVEGKLHSKPGCGCGG